MKFLLYMNYGLYVYTRMSVQCLIRPLNTPIVKGYHIHILSSFEITLIESLMTIIIVLGVFKKINDAVTNRLAKFYLSWNLMAHRSKDHHMYADLLSPLYICWYIDVWIIFFGQIAGMMIADLDNGIYAAYLDFTLWLNRFYWYLTHWRFIWSY